MALSVAVVAISFAAILFRAAPELNPLTAAGWRLLLAGLLLSPFFGHLPRASRPAVALAGLAYAVHFGAWVASLGLVSVLVSVTTVTTTPLLLALLGLLSGRDRPSARLMASLALGVVGVALLATSAPDDAPPPAPSGVWLALLGAAAMAAYLLLARGRGGSGLRSSLAFAGAAALGGGIALLAAAALSGAPLLPASASEALVVLGAAALPQLVGHTLMTWALTRTTPTVVALATLGEPIGAALLAAMLLGEPLTGLGAVACLITLGAVALALSERAGGGEGGESR